MKQNKIAITGGIGSGKSTVAELIRQKGYPVYSADEEYKLVLQDETMLKRIDEAFHVVKDGTLDRKALSQIVFSNEKALLTLNELTHPVIMERMEQKMKEAISFAEVPLLFEEGYERHFDHVIVVLRELPLRIRSVMERNNLSELEVIRRIKNQFDYEKNDLSSHTIIRNNGDLVSLASEVDIALETIL